MSRTTACVISGVSVLALSLGMAGLAMAAAAPASGSPLSAAMNGPSEKPTPGDTDGTGTANVRVNLAQSQVCYDLQVANIAPATMAHIHKGAPTEAGGVVLSLTPPNAAGKSSGCVSGDPGLVKDILQNPGAYYVNVHNADFPVGAIRGQLHK